MKIWLSISLATYFLIFLLCSKLLMLDYLLCFGLVLAMAPHSSTLAWKIPWTEEPGGLQSMGSLRLGHDWATSLSLFTFMHWRRKWQPTPVFLPVESQGWESLVGCTSMGSHRVGHDWSDLAAAAAVFPQIPLALTISLAPILQALVTSWILAPAPQAPY